MNTLFYPILIPLVFGLIVLVIPGVNRAVRGSIALIGALVSAWWAGVIVLSNVPAAATWVWFEREGLLFTVNLRIDSLSALMLVAAMVFTVLIIMYSLGARKDTDRPHEYYAYLLWTAGMSAAVFLADNMLVLVIGWEVVSVLLYLLITMGGDGAHEAAGKTMIMTGFSDSALLAGVITLWALTGTARMSEIESISTASMAGTILYLLFLTGALVKAGAIPGHTWIPSAAEHAPVSVMAFLPASLDKLLGIYLLARISLDLFVIGPLIGLMLMIIGAVTIIAAVMMALVQHDLKKLLAFHAVSQVGYMIAGIGTGIPAGIMGGLFHMLNNAIYKCCLFLGAGIVEEKAGTTSLERLGGMARTLPVTFACMLVAALAISGVPPLNGFASKWLIYEGLVERGSIVFLVAAMFGSALTLASFVKVIYSVFFGSRPQSAPDTGREHPLMVTPMLVLALLCVLFGVFAQVPLRYFISPIIGLDIAESPQMLVLARAMWSPTFTTLLILVALVLGLVVYLLLKTGSRRTTTSFVGGEMLDDELKRFPGTGFYETIRGLGVLSTVYRDAEQGVYDLYVLAGAYGSRFVKTLRSTHNGVLSTYVAFALAGLGCLLFYLVR